MATHNDPISGARYPDLNSSTNPPQDIQNAVNDLSKVAGGIFDTATARDAAFSNWVAAGNTMVDGLTCRVGGQEQVYRAAAGGWTGDVFVPMSGEYTATTNGVPSATIVGLGSSILVRRQSGGLSASTATDKITIPAGLWSCAWVGIMTPAVSGSTVTVSGRAFAQILGEDNLVGDRRTFAPVNEDSYLGATFLFSLAASTQLTFQFFLTLTGGNVNIAHSVRLYRLGGMA